MIDVKEIGASCLDSIKRAPWFPIRSGNLKFAATSGSLIDKDTYLIKIDVKLAPYAQFLEEGTGPHNIPGAFGKPLPFGTKGKFDGMFHPGSAKHKGFVSGLMVSYAIHWTLGKTGGRLDDNDTGSQGQAE